MPISKINTTSITDNSVTAGKIVAGAVDADIAAGSIDTAQIADDAVTTDKLANAINTSIAAKAPIASPTFTGTTTANLLATNGNILGLQANGTTFGNIGVEGDNLYITGQAGNTGGIYMNDAAVSPAYQGAERDNYYNLGKAPARWKDLYLSGGAYLGGTGAANKLDDYEEGYYDPSVSAYGTNGAFGFAGASNTLAYTKIGRTVHVQGYISITDMSGTDTGHLIMSIPFASATLNDDVGYNLSSVLLQNHGGSIAGNIFLFVIGSTAYFYKVLTDGSAGYIMVQHIDTTFQIGVNFTYLAS